MADDTLYVKIRTWDDMLQEYGACSSDDPDIAVPNVFTQVMEISIPDDRIIEVKQLGRSTFKWYPEPRLMEYYIISEEMIEQKYGSVDPRTDPSIILPTKNTKVSEPAYNHIRHEYYLVAAVKNYLHSDMIIRTSTMPYETGYYPTWQSALFAKLRFERLQQKGDYCMTSLSLPTITIPFLTLTLLVVLDLLQGV